MLQRYSGEIGLLHLDPPVRGPLPLVMSMKHGVYYNNVQRMGKGLSFCNGDVCEWSLTASLIIGLHVTMTTAS